MVIAYPVANKAKSLDICKAFVQGCGGDVAFDGRLRDGPAFFYGVDESNVQAWRAVQLDLRRDYYYCDNSYFDKSRQKYFRITKNALQHSGSGVSDCKRFESLGIEVLPWREKQEHSSVILCPQSGHFMRCVANIFWDWTDATKAELRLWTAREFVVRQWSPDKGKMSRTLEADLILGNAHALVTYSSAAAIAAALSGVPTVSTGSSAARAMGGALHQIEDLPTPDRTHWAGVLADNQWTLDEMRDGKAWAALNG
jgi:hypothetical protein